MGRGTEGEEMSDHWDNDTKLGIRTKLALRILMLMFKILAPYEFEHRFEKENEAIAKAIDEAK